MIKKTLIALVATGALGGLVGSVYAQTNQMPSGATNAPAGTVN